MTRQRKIIFKENLSQRFKSPQDDCDEIKGTKLYRGGDSEEDTQGTDQLDDFLEENEYGPIFHSPNHVGMLISAAVFLVYLNTVHPSLPGGDSGELIVAAHEFGVAHPPGYPLYTVLSQLFIYLLPFGNVAWRVNLMTASFGALATGVFYVLIFSVTKNEVAGLLGCGILAFSRLFWFWSMSSEVFSLNNLLISLLMLESVHLSLASKEHKENISIKGSLLCGLCLSNQHTSVLFVVFLVPWAFLHLVCHKMISVRLVLKLSLAFVLGLSPYLYLPLSSVFHQARWTWGNHSSLSGFLTHWLRKEYGTWDLLKDHDGQGFLSGLRAYLNHVRVDLSTPVTFLCAFTPAAILHRWHSKMGGVIRVFFLMFLSYVFFFAWRANLDISKPLFFRVVERFWMQADMVLIFMASISYSSIIRFLTKNFGQKNLILELCLIVPLVSIHAYKWWPICNQSENLVVHNFALQSLDSFPQDSIILTKGDLPSNSYRYFHFCENVRPDLIVFDQEVLTYEWSLPMMRKFYPELIFPGDLLHLKTGIMSDGRRSFTFKDFLDANIHRRPIFACIGVQEHEPSWQSDYTLWPYGACWKIVRKDANLNVKKYAKETEHFAFDWPYEWHETDSEDGTWENVANSAMWRAKTATALFYLEHATPMEEGSPTARKLLLEAYKIYTSAIDKHPSFPSYWHKNYAITCEKLARAKSTLKQADLLQKTVVHFSHYIKLDPDDADTDSIRKAIKTLQEYLASSL